MNEEQPAKILDFFVARDARRDGLRQRVSPSIQGPQFQRLYGPVNQPYSSFRESEISDYDSGNDGPGAA